MSTAVSPDALARFRLSDRPERNPPWLGEPLFVALVEGPSGEGRNGFSMSMLGIEGRLPIVRCPSALGSEFWFGLFSALVVTAAAGEALAPPLGIGRPRGCDEALDATDEGRRAPPGGGEESEPRGRRATGDIGLVGDEGGGGGLPAMFTSDSSGRGWIPFANVGVDGLAGDAWAECDADPIAAADFFSGSAAASSLGGLSSVECAPAEWSAEWAECGDARSDSEAAGTGAGGWFTEVVGVGVREEGREDLFSRRSLRSGEARREPAFDPFGDSLGVPFGESLGGGGDFEACLGEAATGDAEWGDVASGEDSFGEGAAALGEMLVGDVRSRSLEMMFAGCFARTAVGAVRARSGCGGWLACAVCPAGPLVERRVRMAVGIHSSTW